MTALLANLGVAVGVIVAGLSLLLSGVGFTAYTRMRHSRMLWVAVAFLGLAVEGILFAFEAYRERADPSVPVLPLLSLGIVLALYFAVLKR